MRDSHALIFTLLPANIPNPNNYHYRVAAGNKSACPKTTAKLYNLLKRKDNLAYYQMHRNFEESMRD